MSQYILLRKENDLLNSLIGQSFNQKTKFQAEKILTEIHSKAQERSIGKMALCYVLDKNEVLGVGGSTLLKDKKGKIISNLILDQFGIVMSKFFRGSSGEITFQIRDNVNSLQTYRMYSTNTNFNNLLAGRFKFQVGSGSTTPTRQDFFIETPFGTAPESLSFAISDGVFNSGLGNFKNSGSINAGGAGTINESINFSQWKNSGGSDKFQTMFRDIISPSAPFVAGQTIALEYTIQL